MAETITSPRNPRVAAVAALQRTSVRKREGKTLLEGPHVLEAAVAGGAALTDVFALEEDETPARLALDDLTSRVTPTVLRVMSGTEHPRGPIGVMEVPDWETPVAQDTLVLHEIGDPGNAGTLLRTAGAFGLQVAATPGTVDIWSPKVLRAAAGAHWTLRVCLVADPVATFRGLGLVTVATVVEGGLAPSEALIGEAPIALFVGSEPHGLPEAVVAVLDRRLTIPMPGTAESLNVAVAGSIALYELDQRRRHG